MHLSDVVTSAIDAILGDERRRVQGPQVGYRCKATYSLLPTLTVSPIATSMVNSACLTVDSFRKQSKFIQEHHNFFFEVMCKVNRLGEIMIKVVLINEFWVHHGLETTLWDTWYGSEDHIHFVSFILNSHPNTVSIVAHVNTNPIRDHKSKVSFPKPTKTSAYISLLANGKVTMRDITPNQKSYVLSADSFCEVNPLMEEKMFLYICSALSLQPQPNVYHPSLFLSGRDVLAMFKSMKEYYSSFCAVTTCPSVHGDALTNGIQCHLSTKHNISCFLEQFCQSKGGRNDILMTAGRHGLHPRTSAALVNLANAGVVHHFVYISCNKDSLIRDFHVLKEGYRMMDVSVFDFFPGTPYLMTVVILRPLSLESLHGSLLVLPVGPPGSGKSLVGRKIQDLFCKPPLARSEVYKLDSPEAQYVVAEALASDSSIPRRILAVEPFATVCIFERDAFFQKCKETLSLHAAKTKTHDALLNSLQEQHSRTVVFLDSTNGSEEARRLYVREWSRNMLKHPPRNDAEWLEAPFIELHFTCRNREELLKRVQTRSDHPCFPSAEPEQICKIDKILEAINESSCLEYFCVPINNDIVEKHSIECAQRAVALYSFLSPSIAASIMSNFVYSC